MNSASALLIRRCVVPVVLSIGTLSFLGLASDSQGQRSVPSDQGEVRPSVLVTTDKVSYKTGEVVGITIRNLTGDVIYAHVGVEGIRNIEKMGSQGGWEKLLPRCQPPHCFYDIGPPEEIGPDVAKTFVWKPLTYVGGTTKVLSASPGTYRLSFLWQDRHRKEWKVVYSNNFDMERP